MSLTSENKQRIISVYQAGFHPYHITALLRTEGVLTTQETVEHILRQYSYHKNALQQRQLARPLNIPERAVVLAYCRMLRDSEATATQLHSLFASEGLRINLEAVLANRGCLGWAFGGSRFKHRMPELHRSKRIEWAMQNYHEAVGGDFLNVVWSGYATISVDVSLARPAVSTGRSTGVRRRQIKVHVWAGISKIGPTSIHIGADRVYADEYIEILENYLLPFLRRWPYHSHRFIQINTSVHSSRTVTTFLSEQGVTWWPIPPESPDLNPIENLWWEVREWVRAVGRPRDQQQLVEAVRRFWSTVDYRKCCTYIGHLRRVVPQVVELNGESTGY